ncbi:MAG: hypothetical protein GKS06_02635 [Acidobacteria bacterium]|nr:hypothetical protein [Acidobacteriota bacterium]
MKRFIGGLLAFALLVTVWPATAVAQDGGDTTDRFVHNDWRRDRFYLAAGGLAARHDTIDELNARDFPVGRVIDWEDTLGLAENTTTFWAEGHLKPHPRHRFRFSYYQVKRGSDATVINEEIQYGDLLIPLEVTVNTRYNTRTIRADYRFSVIQSRRVDIGIALGLYVLKLEGEIGINGTTLGESVSESAPLPMAGIDIEWDFAPKLVFKGGFQVLGIKVGSDTTVDGNWGEYRARIEWMPFRNFGLGAGYLHNTINADIVFGSGVIRDWSINYSTGGITFYGILSF